MNVIEKANRRISAWFVMERNPQTDAIEERFKEIVAEDQRIIGYHDFRIMPYQIDRL